MIPLKLSEVAAASAGALNGADIQIDAVTTDTRQLSHLAAAGAKSLFVALKGENFDGHDFAQQAVEQGAAALLVDHLLPLKVVQVVVADTQRALGQLGALVRQRVNPKILAITGSCGKTTVKEMAAAILRQQGEVLATAGNFNNEIGLPLTLLRLEPTTQFAVVELGANHPGEIAWTTSLAKPDAAIINNVAAAHLEGFGSIEGVARAKSEIFQGLPTLEHAIVNRESQFWPDWQRQGIESCFAIDDVAAPYHGKDIQIHADGCAEATLVTPSGEVRVRLPLPGRHNIGNALAASAGALALGASLAAIKAGLETMLPVKGRFCVSHYGQLTLIDDTYNASVESVLAGIDALTTMGGFKVLIFGDMKELGESSHEQHRRVGLHAKARHLDAVLCVGGESLATSEAAEGLHFADKGALFAELKELLAQHPHATLLVKGARGSKMEEIVAMVQQLVMTKNLEQTLC